MTNAPALRPPAARRPPSAAGRWPLAELGYTAVFRYREGKQDWIEAGLPESAATVS